MSAYGVEVITVRGELARIAKLRDVDVNHIEVGGFDVFVIRSSSLHRASLPSSPTQ